MSFKIRLLLHVSLVKIKSALHFYYAPAKSNGIPLYVVI